MTNELLVTLANSVLGTGKRTARGNQAHTCPYCGKEKKLEVNYSLNKKGKNPWHCWVCNKAGTRISTLFKKLKASPEKMQELYTLIGQEEEVEVRVEYKKLELPKEIKSLLDNNDIIARHAKAYLKRRNITREDIIKYNIGYCDKGDYNNRIIIPSYDQHGELNYYTARSFEKDAYQKYKNPETSRDIVPFEMFINWNLPVVLCEGPFDAIAIKRNAIPLLGKNITPSLMKKIVTSEVKKIYIALDNDAMKQTFKYAEDFISQGKEVYLVELEGKDPSEMGFEDFTKLIQQTLPISQFDLMERKLFQL